MRATTALKIVILAICIAFFIAPGPQSPNPSQPAWRLSLISLPTNLRTGSVGSEFGPVYKLVATNVGGGATSGPVSYTATLPPGVKPIGVIAEASDLGTPSPGCSRNGQVVTCTTLSPVYPGRSVGARVPVEVTAASGEQLTAAASISGGGGEPVATSAPTEISTSPPPFGLLPGSNGMSVLLTRGDGTAETQAGAHPAQMTIDFAFPVDQLIDEGPTTGAGHLRDLIVELPRGVLGNPTATAKRCTEAELVFSNGVNKEGQCPDSSQVGTVAIMSEVTGPTVITSPVYNMVPPVGAAAELGFEALKVGIYVHILAGIRSDGDYGISVRSEDIVARSPNPVLSVQANVWGDPSAASHDEIRGECNGAKAISSCPVPAGERTGKPFLTMPSDCSGPLITTARVDSWEESGTFRSRGVPSADTKGNSVGVNGCSTLEFDPELTLQPTAVNAETPTGVQVDLEVPQNEELLKENGDPQQATSTLKDVTVTFPLGMAINPAVANGLSACTPDQIGMTTGVGKTPIHFSADRPQCPSSSKIGTVEVNTPLLDHPLPGAVYVAQPYQNPFGTLLGAYVVIDSPEDGIVAKLAGRTEANAKTGQLTVSFTENPEVPFSHFKVNLFGGPRATLRTPSTCGTFATVSAQTPWSGTESVSTSSTFEITQGANGRSCVADESQMPSSPSFEAGTLVPIAGSFSPFLARLQRDDGTQQLKRLNATLPAGLTGRLAGTETCADTAIAAAEARTGTEELANPSCPVGSQIGEVKAAAGAGPSPFYTTGKVYLAGPVDGAPISGVAIVPAVAGPFDLGTVVVRAPAHINPATAVLSIKSGEFPQILEGVPLEVRDAQLSLSRPEFTLNPTNCDPKAVTGEAISVFDQITPLSQRFQVGGCKGLDYKPKLSIRLFGGTGRGAHPRLRAILQAKLGESNTSRASVALPRSEFLENAHIGTVCTRVQFAADNCPIKAIYGHARAITPLLDEPLEGPSTCAPPATSYPTWWRHSGGRRRDRSKSNWLVALTLSMAVLGAPLTSSPINRSQSSSSI